MREKDGLYITAFRLFIVDQRSRCICRRKLQCGEDLKNTDDYYRAYGSGFRDKYAGVFCQSDGGYEGKQ